MIAKIKEMSLINLFMRSFHIVNNGARSLLIAYEQNNVENHVFLFFFAIFLF